MRRHHVILGLAAASFLVAALLLLTRFWLWGIVALGEAVLILLIGLRARRPSFAWSGPAPAPAPAAGIDPDEVDLSGLEEPVRACPHCGYLAIRAPTMSDGGVPGVSELMDRVVCGRCGYQGIAVEFRSREDYRGFLHELRRGASG